MIDASPGSRTDRRSPLRVKRFAENVAPTPQGRESRVTRRISVDPHALGADSAPKLSQRLDDQWARVATIGNGEGRKKRDERPASGASTARDPDMVAIRQVARPSAIVVCADRFGNPLVGARRAVCRESDLTVAERRPVFPDARIRELQNDDQFDGSLVRTRTTGPRGRISVACRPHCQGDLFDAPVRRLRYNVLITGWI